MAHCYQMNLPKLNPKKSLMDRSVVENFIRVIFFPLYFFHTVSYVCLFLNSMSKDSILSSTISFPSILFALTSTRIVLISYQLALILLLQPMPAAAAMIFLR
jgi:hypothetical protein